MWSQIAAKQWASESIVVNNSHPKIALRSAGTAELRGLGKP